MATPSSRLVTAQRLVVALRSVAARLRSGEAYQWGHFGMCNCGQLAQALTGLSPHQIHEAALARGGDWQERARDYCPTSGYAIDEIIHVMVEHDLSTADLGHLEALDDPQVLRALPERRHLRRNVREDVIAYFETWAALLEARIPASPIDRRIEADAA